MYRAQVPGKVDKNFISYSLPAGSIIRDAGSDLPTNIISSKFTNFKSLPLYFKFY